MKKIKNNTGLISLVIALVFPLVYAAHASAAVVTCTTTPAHITGIVNLPVTKYGQNYPLNRGDFHIKSTQQFSLSKCSSKYISYFDTFSMQGPLQFSQSSDKQGNEAWVLPDPGGDSIFSMGIEPSFNNVFFTAEATDQNLWATSAAASPFTLNSSANTITSNDAAVDIVSLSNWKVPSSGSAGSVVYNVGQTVAKVSFKSDSKGNTPYYDAVILDSLTVNYVVSSCGIKSKSSIVDFGDIYKTDIVQGAVAARPFNVLLICGNENDPPSPVNITFNATSGIEDAAAGIIKTNLNGIGLKLSWANSSLPPLMLDQVNHSTLSGTSDYSVMAKPVAIYKPGLMAAGKMDTSLTMSVEFQ